MWQQCGSAFALLAIVACGPLGVGAVALAAGRPRRLREGETSLVMPLAFEQRLLICNAYPSSLSMAVRKNDHETLTGNEDGIPFRQCRSMASQVQKQDKLVFQLQDQVVEGTFEVGELPIGDSVLLLVLGRRQSSKLIAFSSFAFPSGAGTTEAQLAVIDAFAGNNTMAHHSARLRMEGHAAGGVPEQSEKREEELNFNRVYMIEEGAYNASVVEKSTGNASQLTKRPLRLTGRGNYVVLNTGDGGEFPQQLTIFPDQPLHSGSWRQALSSPALALLALLATACMI